MTNDGETRMQDASGALTRMLDAGYLEDVPRETVERVILEAAYQGAANYRVPLDRWLMIVRRQLAALNRRFPLETGGNNAGG